jgi:hypothetical protein
LLLFFPRGSYCCMLSFSSQGWGPVSTAEAHRRPVTPTRPRLAGPPGGWWTRATKTNGKEVPRAGR